MWTSSGIFPYFQVDSTIFQKGNFLKHTPDSKNFFIWEIGDIYRQRAAVSILPIHKLLLMLIWTRETENRFGYRFYSIRILWCVVGWFVTVIVDRFVIPFGVTFVGAKFLWIRTLDEYLVHSCQIRIGKWVTFQSNVKWSNIIEYSQTPPN